MNNKIDEEIQAELAEKITKHLRSHPDLNVNRHYCMKPPHTVMWDTVMPVLDYLFDNDLIKK